MNISFSVYYVFPAYAGVILLANLPSFAKARVPRVCGGDPFKRA